MKKIISLLIVLSICISLLCSCNNGNGGTSGGTSDTGGGAGEADKGNGTGNGDTQISIGTSIGKTCPDYKIPLLFSDEKVSINSLRGKVVVINFWGTWCGPCKSELPHFNEIANEKADEVVILTVHSIYTAGDAPDKSTYITENFPDSKMIFASDEMMGQYEKYFHLLGGNGGYPFTVILDENGVIKYKRTGAFTKEALLSEINNAKAN